VCGKVINVNSQETPIFLDIGYSYPNSNRFTVVVWPAKLFGITLKSDPIVIWEKYNQYIGETVCVIGFIESYKGIPQINQDILDEIIIQKY
jgi:hypothetical protein